MGSQGSIFDLLDRLPGSISGLALAAVTPLRGWTAQMEACRGITEAFEKGGESAAKGKILEIHRRADDMVRAKQVRHALRERHRTAPRRG